MTKLTLPNTKPIMCKIIDKVEECEDTYTFLLDLPTKVQNAKPGQFVMLWVPGVDEFPIGIAGFENGILEIGVAKGGSFLAIDCPMKIGIDPKPIHSNLIPNLRTGKDFYFQNKSDDFFNENQELFKDNNIDIALIDGEHSYKQSLRDVENILRHLSPNGFIILHDCNPQSEIHATPIEFLNEALSKDQYKRPVRIQKDAAAGNLPITTAKDIAAFHKKIEQVFGEKKIYNKT